MRLIMAIVWQRLLDILGYELIPSRLREYSHVLFKRRHEGLSLTSPKISAPCFELRYRTMLSSFITCRCYLSARPYAWTQKGLRSTNSFVDYSPLMIQPNWRIGILWSWCRKGQSARRSRSLCWTLRRWCIDRVIMLYIALWAYTFRPASCFLQFREICGTDVSQSWRSPSSRSFFAALVCFPTPSMQPPPWHFARTVS